MGDSWDGHGNKNRNGHVILVGQPGVVHLGDEMCVGG